MSDGRIALMAATKAAPQSPTERKPPSSSRIFIGAGIDTLAGAVLLAQASFRVLVLKRNKEPG